MRSRDTSPEAHAVQIKAYRAMTPAQRMEVVAVMSDEGRQIAEEGITRRHPNYDDEQVRKASMRLRYGRALCERIWPNERLPVP